MSNTKQSDTQTFTVTISIYKFKKLKWLADMQNIAATSALEKAIETEFLVQREISKGKRILIFSPDKTFQELVFR